MEKSAILSDCGQYRYQLTRRWGDGLPVVWIMLNPSTADAVVDDQTIKKCIGFTERMGRQALTVVNLFAFRATLPEDMKATSDPIGPENDSHIDRVALTGALTVCAWGTDGTYRGRDKEVAARLKKIGVQPVALSITKHGHPGHPVMLGYARELVPFLL